MTDEQVNRIMSGQDKLWDTHENMNAGGLATSDRHLYGPGLNVTVPRAPTTSPFPPDMRPATRWGDDLPAPETRYDPYNEGITEADLAVEMRRQGLGLPPVALVTAGAICQQAADITAGDRQQQNGDKLPNHENIAALWSAYLGVPIDAHQAATMMVLLKVARTKLGSFNTDDYVDMAGYAGCAAEIRHRSNQEAQ